jgi:hypothetical protein
MDHHQILRLLFVRGLTTILLVGGLGVEEKQNGLGEIPFLFRVLYFCGVGAKRKSTDQNEEQFMN